MFFRKIIRFKHFLKVFFRKIIRIEQYSKVFIIVLQKVHQKPENSIKNSSDLILLGQISQLGNGSAPARQRLGNTLIGSATA